MNLTAEISQRLGGAINRQRLIDTAALLLAVPSRTGEAGAAADCLAELLAREGFTVERPDGGFAAAPAVVVRLDSKRPGKTLQFDGHLDTVHLPFVPPHIEGDLLTGSGAADMKSGLAAAVEALRVLRDTTILVGGAVAHGSRSPRGAWGFGQQLDCLIKNGYVGDAVLLPEPLSDRLPVVGRGAATWKVVIRRDGPPVHEVMRPEQEPSVIAAGAALVAKLDQLQSRLSTKADSLAGQESVFIGQIHGGEIYNQYPQECWLEGTRRWLPGTSRAAAESEFRLLLAGVAQETGTTIDADFRFIRDAFLLDQQDPFVIAFQQSFEAHCGRPLPIGPKPFVDDGNSFWGLAHVPAITHGPRAGGQHTVNEWVSIEDLMRVAHLYALTTVAYCA